MWNVTWLVKLSRLSLRTDINNHNSFQESKVTKAASSQHSNDWCVWSISNTFLPLMQIFLITLHGMNLWTLSRQEGPISCLPWLEGAVNLPNLVWPKFMLKYLPGNAHKLLGGWVLPKPREGPYSTRPQIYQMDFRRRTKKRQNEGKMKRERVGQWNESDQLLLANIMDANCVQCCSWL